jgi:hypothetical protein
VHRESGDSHVQEKGNRIIQPENKPDHGEGHCSRGQS